MPQPYHPAYVKSIQNLLATHHAIAKEDIFSDKGEKLVGKGIHVGSELFDRIHTLTPHMDQLVEVKDSVTPEILTEQAKKIMESHPGLAKANALFPEIWRPISAIPLSPALSFKLTLARSSQPEIFEHSLKVALISLCLATSLSLPEEALVALAASALFHDIGMLHIDPAILSKSHVLSVEERHHLYAHPLTAYLILDEFKEYHPAIARGVLEHHERLDGSGYPQRLIGDQISLFGKILAVAEVAEVLLGQDRLEIVLRLNENKLDAKLADYAITLFKTKESPPGGEPPTLALIESQLFNLEEAFSAWERSYYSCCKYQPEMQDSEVLRFVNDRIGDLKRNLYIAGFNPVEINQVTLGLEEDPEGLREIKALISESYWQIGDITHELERLRPDFKTCRDEDCQIVREWLDTVKLLLELN